MLDTERIENELLKRVLPPKLQAGQSATSQSFPQFLFSRSLLTALVAGGLNNLASGFAARFAGHD